MRLIPRDEVFFSMFASLASRVTASARLLEELFANPARLAELATSIKQIEHEADTITHDVIARINRTFVTPIDREDIHLLASRLDDVIDQIDGTARRALMFRIGEVNEPAIRLSQILIRAGEAIEGAVTHVKKPTIVVIQIGCNDARRLAKETFKSSLEELIDKLRKAQVQVVQCTLTSVGEKHDGTNEDDPKLDEFAQIEREVAKAKNVPVNDLRKAFVAHWKANNPKNEGKGILTYDGNHFNDAGHRFVAEQMLKRFQ